MKLKKIKTPEDILQFMEEKITYGWVDINDKIHIGNLKQFRKLYRTLSVDETLKYRIGTCIEQAHLISTLLTYIGIKNKMFCTRIYEEKDFNNIEEDEHMHCFVLFYLNDKVYQIEHANSEKKGIHEFDSEEEAIKIINEYYEKLSNGISRPVTEFFDVESNLTFKDFNNYINSIDEHNKIKKKNSHHQ